MTRDKLEELCTDLGWFYGGAHRNGWVVASCPLAPLRHANGTDQTPSFGIEIGSDPPRCVCLSCGFKGKLSYLLTELLRYPKLLPKGSERRKNAVRWLSGLPTIANNVEDETIMPVHMAKPNTHDPYFPESWLQAYRSAEKVSVAMKYLMGRGVALETIIRMDIRFDPYSDRVCFPIRDYTGQLRGMQGRGIRPDAKPKYLFYTYEQQSCGREVLLGEDMVDPTRPVLLVEGAFDMAKLMPSTKQVLVLWGASVNAQRIERLKKFPKIYTLLDNDAAGDNARKALKQSTLPVTNLKVPEQYKDVGEMPDPALHQYAELVDSYASII